MDTIDWNLDQREFQTIEIVQIQFIQGLTDLSDSQEKLRLLVLSHEIANFGCPAFFLDSSPDYIKDNATQNSVVIVFDFDNKFYNFYLQPFFKPTSFTINFETLFTNEIIDHIQRAMTLLYYYNLYDHFPIYHSSFLLFTCTDNWCDPFILQFIPIRIENRLRFRVIILSDLQMQIDSQNPLKEQSVILISPFEHPFFVISSDSAQITVQYVDNTIKTFTRSDIRVSRILKPSPSLLGLYQDMKTIKSRLSPSSETFSELCGSGPKSFENAFFEEELHDFFQKKIELKYQKEMEENQIQSSEFKDLPATIDVIITEQIKDSKIRYQISNTLKPLNLFPSKRHDLKLSITRYDTFFERNYGILKMSIPNLPKPIYSKTATHFAKIEIPNVVVAQKTQLFEISALNVINSWFSENLRPISGPKNAHYVVFADSILKQNHTKQFFSHLTHTYSLYGFGELTIYPKESALFFSNPEDIKNNAISFCRKNQLLEFATFPTVFFIIADRNYTYSMRLNMHTIFITPHDVDVSNFDFFKLISFHIYSQIRMHSNIPNAEIRDSIGNSEKFKPLDIFFGFRYQPPFLLQRVQENVLILHVFWDPITTESVWTDDTGSSLHAVKMKNLFSIISAYDELKKIFSDIKVVLTIGLLTNDISPKLIEPIKSIPNINLYAISAAPFIQVSYSTKTDEDSIIFADFEQTSYIPEENAKPIVCCYVVSRKFPAYFLSLYFTSNANQTETLKEIATNLSNLSWLSVKPGSESRTIGFPPALNLLFQKIPANINSVNLFEFLPFNDTF